MNPSVNRNAFANKVPSESRRNLTGAYAKALESLNLTDQAKVNNQVC